MWVLMLVMLVRTWWTGGIYVLRMAFRGALLYVVIDRGLELGYVRSIRGRGVAPGLLVYFPTVCCCSEFLFLFGGGVMIGFAIHLRTLRP